VQLPPPLLSSELEHQANLLNLRVLDLALIQEYFSRMHYTICHFENKKLENFIGRGLVPSQTLPSLMLHGPIPENDSTLMSVSPQRRSWLGMTFT